MDGTSAAAGRGLAVLREGGPALEAAIAAVVHLEDDCRFNAGTGSNIRLDGKTVQMDAAVMDGATGRFAAVAAIERVKNPVLVARKVLETPHVLVVGEGATRLARLFGFPDHDPICKDSREKYERVKRILLGKESGPALQAWKTFDWRRFWNFPPQEAVEKALAAFPPDVDIGIVAVGRTSEGGGATWSAERKAFGGPYRENMAWSVAR